ncbi:imelysin family protein [Novispirillum itersonii]|uniref:Imelysin-like domain-containing protein n=1 Tax=Novispirillum itersonii TaxID=189 RepID=A0A7X0DL37_NOVIT|nr:imelysin family protein [Novispirillum itersonii]MBB6209581.1 hypothetical protein [Novispirillum itersonii]
MGRKSSPFMTVMAGVAVAAGLSVSPALAGKDTENPRVVSDADMMALVVAQIDHQIIPGYQAFSVAAATLAQEAGKACADSTLSGAEIPAVRGAHAAAFTAWQRVQHLRLGPVMEQDRFHRIEYWPDPKGLGGKHLKALLTEADPPALKEVEPGRGFRGGSIAVQGFPALERLLWDDAADGTPQRRCQVVTAIADTVKTMAADTLDGWTRPDGFRQQMLAAETGTPAFRAPVEALKALHGSLSTGLQVMADLKLSGPLGSGPDKARAEKGEAWRADLTLAALRANAEAARTAYYGSSAGELSLRTLVRRHPDGEDVDVSVSYGLTEALRLLETLKGDWRGTLGSAEGYRTLQLVRGNLQTALVSVQTDVNGILGLGIGFNALDGD